MLSAKVSSPQNPLERYHELLRDHEELVVPRLQRLRREIDEAMGELRRLEKRHLDRQRRVLAELREQLAHDARLLLRAVKFAVFSEQLAQASSWLPAELRATLPRDPSAWSLAALPLPLAIESCELSQEEGYEDEHECLRDVLQLEIRLGAVQARAELERGRRLLSDGFREVPLVYQHQELTFALIEALGALNLGEAATRQLASEAAVVVLYAVPMLLEEPSGASFSYPLRRPRPARWGATLAPPKEPPMRRSLQLDLLDRLMAHVEAGTTQLAPHDALLEVDRYTSPERFAAERDKIFRRSPLIVGHASQLPKPGDVLTFDAVGVPMLVVRGEDGELRAFVNACRHRGARMVTEERASRRSLVCRYHAWCYALDGRLLHTPQPEAFPSLDCAATGLIPLPLEVRHGFLFVTPGGGEARPVAPMLGEVDDDLAHFSLGSHVVHHRVVQRRAFNWKLLIDAFQEGYHVKSLHRDTVYRFFLEVGALIDRIGPNSRSVGARRELRSARDIPREQRDLRQLTTVFYYLFPNTILVLHPDWISHLAFFPISPSESLYVHTMLIPEPAATDADRARWEKSFNLIEGQVFQKEDISIAESIQSTLSAGLETHFRIGRLEAPVLWFHEALDQALAAPT